MFLSCIFLQVDAFRVDLDRLTKVLTRSRAPLDGDGDDTDDDNDDGEGEGNPANEGKSILNML